MAKFFPCAFLAQFHSLLSANVKIREGRNSVCPTNFILFFAIRPDILYRINIARVRDAYTVEWIHYNCTKHSLKYRRRSRKEGESLNFSSRRKYLLNAHPHNFQQFPSFSLSFFPFFQTGVGYKGMIFRDEIIFHLYYIITKKIRREDVSWRYLHYTNPRLIGGLFLRVSGKN